MFVFFFFQAEDGIRDFHVTGVQTCALPIWPHAHHLGQRHLERLVMLSDGIFAIAITLSAIEIKPESGEDGSLWHAWSTPLLIYFLSFFLIGLIWLVHRRIVAWLSHIDAPGTIINMMLLSL